MHHLHDIALNVLKGNLNVQSSESLLILTDSHKQDIAKIFMKLDYQLQQIQCSW